MRCKGEESVEKVKEKKKKKTSVATKIIYVFLFLLALIYIVPLIWVFFVSFKTNAEIFTSPFALPESLALDNYVVAWTAGKLGKATRNSALVCIITLILSMLVGSMAAFAIGRMRWKFSGAAMVYFMMGMMIPVTVFIMTGFFKSMPNELIESACIDGCSIYQIFYKIALPLSRTGLFVTGLMTFVANWNELLLAMVFISDDTKKTLPVSLSKFVGPYNTNYSQMFAAIVLAIVPTIVVYCCFSNQIVDGLTTGAVKG